MVDPVDPEREGGHVQLDAATKAQVRRLGAEIARLVRAGPILPGTLTPRRTRCGRTGCQCMADPPVLHGPYWSWTRKIDRKTVTRYLSDDEVSAYKVWFDNAKQLRALLAELEGLGLQAVGATRGSREPADQGSEADVGSRRLSRG
ncbi:MAG: DUF6788 family protein [Acidimicrobiales bacterium]